MYLKTAVRVANGVDSDQVSQNAATGMGLHYLLRPICPNT